MTTKNKLLIFYDWFYPGFRAGGPIQSLTNLTIALASEFEIYVITSAFDLNSDAPLTGITIDTWNEVLLPGSAIPVKVFYATKKTLSKPKIGELIKEVAPGTVYLNGIFSYRFFLLPLLVLRKRDGNLKVVICPRGMLKKGALSGKSFKKKIYIRYLQLSGLVNKVYWHATTNEEVDEIHRHFPANKGVLVAANIPKKPLDNISYLPKQSGELKLVYLSLINEHKNLLLLLRVIKELEAQISLDIYGPVIDEIYWKTCVEVIKELPGKVQYKGAVEPARVQEIIEQYHAFVLLTKGENFGHAIFESLSVGRPVITSNFTPWQQLYENRAGVNVDIDECHDCMAKLNLFSAMYQGQYDAFCSGAYTVAADYYSSLNNKEKYRLLFSPG